MREARGWDLIERYRANYGIPAEVTVTEQMVLEHWELEKGLAKRLLDSTPDERPTVFEECYSTLYGKLYWLNALAQGSSVSTSAAAFMGWRCLIGEPPKRIYEVGSGKGELISWLAANGFECRGSEITSERGSKWTTDNLNLSWGASDGIHLDRFEPMGRYDVVVSNQVVEHLHPDDLLDHFKGVFSILAHGGRYILSTPHASSGPCDISRVFREDRTLGMHLKEYTYGEIASALTCAGFQRVDAVMRLPARVRQRLGVLDHPIPSRLYRHYLQALEMPIGAMPTQRLKRTAASAAKLFGFRPNIMVVAHK